LSILWQFLFYWDWIVTFRRSWVNFSLSLNRRFIYWASTLGFLLTLLICLFAEKSRRNFRLLWFILWIKNIIFIVVSSSKQLIGIFNFPCINFLDSRIIDRSIIGSVLWRFSLFLFSVCFLSTWLFISWFFNFDWKEIIKFLILLL